MPRSHHTGVAGGLGRRRAEASDERIRLVLYVVALDGDELTLHDDHDELRWLGTDELDDVGWLPIDRELVGSVSTYLGTDP
jgi:hypothetical protein